MKRPLCAIALTCVAALCCSAQVPGNRFGLSPAYELYSWLDSKGGWNFCMLASPSGVQITAEQVFGNRICLMKGTVALKRKIATLPAGTLVYWDYQMLSHARSEPRALNLKYPSMDIIQRIRDYAKKHRVEVQLNDPLSVHRE